MKSTVTRSLLFLSTMIAPIAAFGQSPGTTNDTLRILTFNVWARPDTDWPARRSMILDALERFQPDLIGLQEVVQPAPVADNRAQELADSLFERTGYAYDHRYEFTHFSFSQWNEGIAIMSRHLILDTEVLALPPGVFPRKVICVRVLTTAGIVDFCNTHLSFGAQQTVRASQVEAIKAFVAQRIADGTQYMARVAVIGDSSFGMTQTAGTFTVNNPGNAPPELQLRSPKGGEQIGGVHEVRWQAADPDGDVLFISLDLSSDAGSTWIEFARNVSNTGSYNWDTKERPNSPFSRLRLRCFDGTLEVADTSGTFSIQNERTAFLPESLFRRLAGEGDGTLKGVIVDPAQLTGNLYRLTLDDTLFAQKSYDVRNLDTGEQDVRSATAFDGVTEGPYFQGQSVADQGFPKSRG